MSKGDPAGGVLGSRTIQELANLNPKSPPGGSFAYYTLLTTHSSE